MSASVEGVSALIDEARGIDALGNDASGVDRLDAPSREAGEGRVLGPRRQALEVPPRNSVLHREHDRVLVEHARHFPGHRLHLMRFHSEDGDVLRVALGKRIGRANIARVTLAAVRPLQSHAVLNNGPEVGPARDERDLVPLLGKPHPEQTADCYGTGHANFHDAESTCDM